jgi:flagellar motility protein MotE (MotC chaperone)
MASFATLLRNALLLGWLALGGQALAQTQPPPKPPLNLTDMTKPGMERPRPAAKPEAAPVRSQPAAPQAAAAAKPRAKPASEQAQSDHANSDVARFCSNIADAALDARAAWQLKELQAAEAKLKERIAELEAKRAEYEEWLKLREDFLKKAEGNVVEIYSGMDPEAAALQIASMADDTAAAVLAKLRVRNASAILNEMEPARAAHLANTLAGMRRVDEEKTKK